MYYTGDRAVPGVEVALTGPVNQMAETGAAGEYAVVGIPEGTWAVEPGKVGDWGNGVSSLDAAYVLQAVANLRTFSDAQAFACDVTGNGQISSLDAARILQLSVGLIPRFAVADACGSDWLFLPNPAQVQNQLVIQPQISGGTCQPGGIALNPLVGQADAQDFRALLFGDCTGNWRPSSGAAASFQKAAAGGPQLHVARMHGARRGHARVRLYVRSGKPFQSFEVRLAYDPAQLELRGVRMPRSTRNALVRHHTDGYGHAAIAAASAGPLGNHRGAVLVVDFATFERSREAGAIRVLHSTVDEQSAPVVYHPRGTAR